MSIVIGMAVVAAAVAILFSVALPEEPKVPTIKLGPAFYSDEAEIA